MSQIMVLGLFCGALLGAAPPPQPQQFIRVGDNAPPFALRTLNGEEFALNQYVGRNAPRRSRAVVMVFFSSDSIASRRRAPMLASLARRWKSAGVELVFVGARDTESELRTFASELGLDGRIAPDSFGRVSSRYEVTGFPHLVFVNSAGKVVFQQAGDVEWLERLADSQLEAITNAPIPPAEVPPGEEPVSTTLTFGWAPSSSSLAEQWKPLAEFLGRHVGQVQMVPSANYDEFVTSLREQRYDIVSSGALQYVEVAADYEPLVRMVRRDQDFYYGVIFARDDSGITSLGDLRGKTIAFVNAHSTSGFLFPTLLLKEAGVSPDAYTPLFAGSHEAVAKAVLDGTAPAGACFEDCRGMVWPDAMAREEQSTILAFTREIPADPILVKRSLPLAVKAAVRRALKEASADRDLLSRLSTPQQPITAFAPTSADAYALLARAAELLAESNGVPAPKAPPPVDKPKRRGNKPPPSR